LGLEGQEDRVALGLLESADRLTRSARRRVRAARRREQRKRPRERADADRVAARQVADRAAVDPAAADRAAVADLAVAEPQAVVEVDPQAGAVLGGQVDVVPADHPQEPSHSATGDPRSRATMATQISI
jgi:hypothetical protein